VSDRGHSAKKWNKPTDAFSFLLLPLLSLSVTHPLTPSSLTRHRRSPAQPPPPTPPSPSPAPHPPPPSPWPATVSLSLTRPPTTSSPPPTSWPAPAPTPHIAGPTTARLCKHPHVINSCLLFIVKLGVVWIIILDCVDKQNLDNHARILNSKTCIFQG
jgi:hypothetical protein